MVDVKEKQTNRIARNTLLLYIRMLFVMCVSLYTTRIVIHELGVQDFGIYSVVGGFVSIFCVLNSSLSSGFNRYYNYALGKSSDDGVKKVFNSALRIQIVSAFILFFLLETFGLFYINNYMVLPSERVVVVKSIFQFSVIAVIFQIMQIPYSAAVMAYERMDFYALVSVFDAVLKLFTVYLLGVTFYDKLFVYGFLVLGVSIVDFLLYFFYCKFKIKSISFCSSFDRCLLKQMLTFSFWSFLDPFAYTLRGQGSNLLLNAFSGPVVNAAYSLSNQVGGVLDQFAGNLSIAFRPSIIQTYSQCNYERAKFLMYRMSTFSFILQLAIFIPIIFELDYIFQLWLGDSVPYYASEFTTILLMIKIVSILNTPITTIIHSTGNIKLYMILTCSILMFNLPLTWCFLNKGFPPIFLFYIMFLLTIVNQVVSVLILVRLFPIVTIKDYLSNVILPSLFQSCFVLSFVSIVVWVFPEGFIRLVLCFFSSIILSVVSCYFFILSSQERSFIISKVRCMFKL